LNVVTRPMPAAPLVERRRYLVAVAKADACGAAQVLDHGVQVDARVGAQVLNRGAQAVAHGAARCASQVFDRGARPLPAAPLVVHCR
jgi:hypothetical protein